MFEYTPGSFLDPPRPAKKMPPSVLNRYEAKGWVTQVKLNGTCSVIAVDPKRKLHTWGRDGESHKQWDPTEASTRQFRNLPGAGWYVFVAELMHNKVAGGPRDTNYLFDILVDNDNYLVGETFAERMARLDKLFPGGEQTHSHRIFDPHLWIARIHTEGFRDLFDSLTLAQDEGLVVKNPKAKLELCCRPTANQDWMFKVRLPKSTTYSF